MDLKSIDPAVHQAHTGVDNRLILENALIAASLTRAGVRVPVGPGVNDNPAAITAIARFAKLMPGVDTVHLLPYHSFGENKYRLLGRTCPMGALPDLKPEAVIPLKTLVEAEGLRCVIGG